MFNSSTELPDYVKIDQIHRMLLQAKMARRFGILLRLLIIGGLVYGYHYFGQPEHAEQKAKLMTVVRAKFSEFVTPIVNDVMADVLKNMQGQTTGQPQAADGSGRAPNTPQITPEMIRAVQESMQKK